MNAIVRAECCVLRLRRRQQWQRERFFLVHIADLAANEQVIFTNPVPHHTLQTHYDPNFLILVAFLLKSPRTFPPFDPPASFRPQHLPNPVHPSVLSMHPQLLFLPSFSPFSRTPAPIFTQHRTRPTACRPHTSTLPPHRTILFFNPRFQIPHLRGPSLRLSLVAISIALISLNLVQLSSHSLHDLLQLAVPDALITTAATALFSTALANSSHARSKSPPAADAPKGRRAHRRKR